MTPLTLIAAVAENDVIGNLGHLPWRLPSDLKWFRRRTMGKPVLMGRKTFQALPIGLRGREVVVVSRTGLSWDDALAKAEASAQARNTTEIMVAGGAEIYALALPNAARIDLTRVHANVKGDTRFPEIDFAAWEVVARMQAHRAPSDEFAHTMITLVRRKCAPNPSRGDSPKALAPL